MLRILRLLYAIYKYIHHIVTNHYKPYYKRRLEKCTTLDRDSVLLETILMKPLKLASCKQNLYEMNTSIKVKGK